MVDYLATRIKYRIFSNEYANFIFSPFPANGRVHLIIKYPIFHADTVPLLCVFSRFIKDTC